VTENLIGYKGEALRLLKGVGAEIGDMIEIEARGHLHRGTLMPRHELADGQHIVVKLENGYNIGIRISQESVVRKISSGVKPAFIPPPMPKMDTRLPNVSIIGTGGTIASRVDYRTGAVHPALTAEDLCCIFPELSELADISVEILFNIFSEDMKPLHWSRLARRIAERMADGVDGVVVCHGTDTMAYTAAALTFALQQLPVPIVLVGSQRSSDRPSSDAAMNLTGAVFTAGNAPFAEVVVGMHETVSDTFFVLHRGNKVRKCHTSRRDAFESINAAPLARVSGRSITMLETDFLPRNKERKPIVKPEFDNRVALVKFHPGLKPALIKWFVEAGYRGLVLEGTGLGHVSGDLLPPLRSAAERGVLLGMTSQCLWGRVNMNVYDRGVDLQELGVLPMGDMLPETAMVKMMWVLAQAGDLDEARRLLTTNINGELSERTRYRGVKTWQG